MLTSCPGLQSRASSKMGSESVWSLMDPLETISSSTCMKALIRGNVLDCLQRWAWCLSPRLPPALFVCLLLIVLLPPAPLPQHRPPPSFPFSPTSVHAHAWEHAYTRSSHMLPFKCKLHPWRRGPLWRTYFSRSSKNIGQIYLWRE